MHDPDATIVAVATPPGRGGVGCVRLSGPRAVEIAGSLFEPATATLPRPGGRPRFGRFKDAEERPLDHGYLVLFAPDGAYTGELTAEMWPHGSPAVLAALVETAIDRGAEPAGPGEFTYRALRHGRLDLARAEAVRDLVHARTLYQARVAFAQAEGAVSERVRPLGEGLWQDIPVDHRARCVYSATIPPQAGDFEYYLESGDTRFPVTARSASPIYQTVIVAGEAE